MGAAIRLSCAPAAEAFASRSCDMSISYLNFTDWRAQQTVFEHIGVYNWGSYNLMGRGEPQRLTRVTSLHGYKRQTVLSSAVFLPHVTHATHVTHVTM